MSLSNWLAKRRNARGTPPAHRRTSRPMLEALEDRAVPTAGALDTTFGNGGLVTTDFLGPTDDIFRDVILVQGDGKIVVAGTSGPDFTLARFNADGSLDTGFDSDGIVQTDFAGGRDVSMYLLGASPAAARAQARTLSRAIAAMERRFGPYPYDGYAVAELPESIRMVASYGAAVELMDLKALQARGIEVSNTPGAVTEDTADLAFGLIIAACRRGRTLHYSAHKSRCADRDTCPRFSPVCEAPAPPGTPVTHFLLASEKLSEEDVWTEVAEDEIVGVDAQMCVYRVPLLLQPAA